MKPNYKNKNYNEERRKAGIGMKKGKNTKTIRNLLLIVCLLIFNICFTVQKVEAKEKSQLDEIQKNAKETDTQTYKTYLAAAADSVYWSDSYSIDFIFHNDMAYK